MNPKLIWARFIVWFQSKTHTQRWAVDLADKNQQLSLNLASAQAALNDLDSSKSTLDSILRDKEDTIKELQAQIDIFKVQLKMYETLQARELARLEAETAIQVRRKVDALESPSRSPDEYL